MSLMEPVESNNGLPNFNDPDETLSFCDLPLSYSSCTSDWEDFSKKEQSASFEDDFFEFFSQDFTTSPHSLDKLDHIIFCGKLIPFKEPRRVADDAVHSNVTVKPKESKNKGISTWQLDRSRTISPKTRLAATPVKSRSYWYVLSFGSSRPAAEMELTDIRTRLSKKSMQAAKKFQSHNGKEEVKKNITGGTGRRGKGVWSLFQDFGCKSCHAANAVEYSPQFVCSKELACKLLNVIQVHVVYSSL